MAKCNCEGGCASSTSNKSVFACSGASNVGKLSYDLAIELHKIDKYKISCAIGVGADIGGFINEAKSDDNTNLLIDGCPVGCLKHMFDNKGITNYDHIVLTEMGIKKDGTLKYDSEVLPRLINEIEEMGL